MPRQFGCTRMQGYLFSAPKPAAEARRWAGARLETGDGRRLTPFQRAGVEHGGDRRIASRLQRRDGLPGPEVGRLEDFRMAIEIRHVDPDRRRRPHHRVERPDRQRIVALMRHEASPQHVHRARRRGQQLLAERRQHRGDQFEPSRQRCIIDIEHLRRRLAEMHHQIGTALELVHRCQRHIVDQASIDQHRALRRVERRQQPGDRARCAHRLPERPRPDQFEIVGRKIGCDGRERPPAILDPAVRAILMGKRAIERLVIQQRIARPGRPPKASAPDEDLVRAALEMLGFEILGKAGHHGGADAGADKDIEHHAAFAEGLVDPDMRGSKTAAAGGDEADRPAAQKADQAVDIDLVFERDMVMHEGRQPGQPGRGAARPRRFACREPGRDAGPRRDEPRRQRPRYPSMRRQARPRGTRTRPCRPDGSPCAPMARRRDRRDRPPAARCVRAC